MTHVWDAVPMGAGSSLASHAACHLLDSLGGLISEPGCRSACLGLPPCDTVNCELTGSLRLPRCALMRCGEERPLPSAIGAATVHTLRRCGKVLNDTGECPAPPRCRTAASAEERTTCEPYSSSSSAARTRRLSLVLPSAARIA